MNHTCNRSRQNTLQYPASFYKECSMNGYDRCQWHDKERFLSPIWVYHPIMQTVQWFQHKQTYKLSTVTFCPHGEGLPLTSVNRLTVDFKTEVLHYNQKNLLYHDSGSFRGAVALTSLALRIVWTLVEGFSASHTFPYCSSCYMYLTSKTPLNFSTSWNPSLPWLPCYKLNLTHWNTDTYFNVNLASFCKVELQRSYNFCRPLLLVSLPPK